MSPTDEQHLETAPPLTEEEYAQTFAVFGEDPSGIRSSKIADTFISENNLRDNPVSLLSVGAGTGNFEVEMVRELGLNLGYICAIEPNKEHVIKLEQALQGLGVEYDVDTSFFDKNFCFEQEHQDKFDVILFCQSLYGFADPHGAVLHATNFLKPTGKMLILIQGEGAKPDVFSYLVGRSDPQVFSPRKCFGDHSLTAEQIASKLRETSRDLKQESRDLKITTMQDLRYIDVDEFVRRTGTAERDFKVDFMLQARYERLSEEARRVVYDMVVDGCDVVQGRYKLRNMCGGIVVSSAF